MKVLLPAKRLVTQFDSATSVLYALASCMSGRPFKGAGVIPVGFEIIPLALNLLPFKIRQALYRYSGKMGALNLKQIPLVKGREISELVVYQYPQKKKYPAIFIGSSNGAVAHLAAALQVPWLPQTFLISARRDIHPDEIEKDVEWGKGIAQTLRRNNPDFKINQMHDPVQDRLMVMEMGYFRIKRLQLGGVYEDFIREHLEPGGTIVLVDDQLKWPMIQVGDEHTFQIGGLGALNPYEYLNGSERVTAFIKKHGDGGKASWKLPGDVFEGPESEWGFDKRLGEDAARFARENGFKISKLSYDEPESMSPVAADFYTKWFQKENIPAEKLFVECFALLDPWMAMRKGVVPFWLAFNTDPSGDLIEEYLKTHSFEEVYMLLMSNGVEGIGQVPIERWRKIIHRAKNKSEFLGVDESKYPLDLASFVRYHRALKRNLPGAPLDLKKPSLAEVQAFVRSRGGSAVRWE